MLSAECPRRSTNGVSLVSTSRRRYFGAAPALGFAGMVPSVERALQMLAWTKSAKESAVVLADVVAACERAKAA